MTLDDRSFTVVGVMPEAFQFPYGAASVLRSAMAEARVDVWIAEYRPLRSRLSRLVARLKPGATPRPARAEIAAVEARRRSLDAGPQQHGTRAVVPYADAVLGPARRSLWLLFGAVALVLIAACANVANLLLALHRQPDAGGGHASGARRVARTARPAVHDREPAAGARRAVSPASSSRAGRAICSSHSVLSGSRAWTRSSFDWTVFAFLLLVCAVTALFFGVAPALAAGRVDAGIVAKEAGRATDGTTVWPCPRRAGCRRGRAGIRACQRRRSRDGRDGAPSRIGQRHGDRRTS